MDSTTFSIFFFTHNAKKEYAERLPNELFMANRKQFLTQFKQAFPNYAKTIIFMEGSKEIPIDSTGILKTLIILKDENYERIQESYFYYLFGVQEINFYACIELDAEKVTLFAPKVDIGTRIFQCPPRKDEISKKYGCNVIYQHNMEKFITDLNPVFLKIK